MTTYTWTLTNDTTAEGMSILADPPIAEGETSARHEAVGQAYAAVQDAANAAGTTAWGYRHEEHADGSTSGHHTLDDGTHLLVTITPQR